MTPSNRTVGAYSLVLAHDPEALEQRSPLYNAIMFGAKGLPRAERELGVVLTSHINGCAYCASVHAKRFTALTKAPEAMRRIQADGVQAKLEPRQKAIVDYAAKLTRDPAGITPADAAPLRAQGLSDLEILDLTHAVAMFAWANRLIQTLGEATTPAREGNPL
ncbi:MAG TPA: peroxidase-related enzyme [Xanthobacteraceae bacterium]|nr:peroxidase-related enzyme [Xanthobacteraceae bacterium]